MKAEFLTPLDARQIGAHRWMLLDDLKFYSEQYRGVFIAPRGFQCDFASIPLWLGSLVPKDGIYNRCGVIHDAGYVHALQTEDGKRIHTVKQVADDLFEEMLIAVGVTNRFPLFRRSAMVKAVRWFGNPEKHPASQLDSVILMEAA